MGTASSIVTLCWPLTQAWIASRRRSPISGSRPSRRQTSKGVQPIALSFVLAADNSAELA